MCKTAKRKIDTVTRALMPPEFPEFPELNVECTRRMYTHCECTPIVVTVPTSVLLFHC